MYCLDPPINNAEFHVLAYGVGHGFWVRAYCTEPTKAGILVP